MRITIEDLEALKELSDELEENHMETEKQLNEDLGASNFKICQWHAVWSSFTQQRRRRLRFENISEKSKVSKRHVSTMKAPSSNSENSSSNFKRSFLFFICCNVDVDYIFWLTVNSTNCARKPKPPNPNRLRRLLEQRTSCPSTWNYKHPYKKIKHELSTSRSRVSRRRSAKNCWASFKYVTCSLVVAGLGLTPHILSLAVFARVVRGIG